MAGENHQMRGILVTLIEIEGGGEFRKLRDGQRKLLASVDGSCVLTQTALRQSNH